MEAITVALISLVGTVTAVLIEKGRRENKEDHNNLVSTINRIEQKIDDHMSDHAFSELTKRVRRKAINKGA
jgi:hypothetical protein